MWKSWAEWEDIFTFDGIETTGGKDKGLVMLSSHVYTGVQRGISSA